MNNRDVPSHYVPYHHLFKRPPAKQSVEHLSTIIYMPYSSILKVPHLFFKRFAIDCHLSINRSSTTCHVFPFWDRMVLHLYTKILK